MSHHISLMILKFFHAHVLFCLKPTKAGIFGAPQTWGGGGFRLLQIFAKNASGGP